MRWNAGIRSILCLCASLIMAASSVAFAQDLVSAKLGIQIQSSGRVSWAKANERLTTSDKFRIYIAPKEDVYLYVVHTDEKVVSPLINETLIKKDILITLPLDDSQFYQFDGSNKKESITIICSPTRRVDIWELLSSGNVRHSKWAEVEQKLVAANKIVLGGAAGEPSSQQRILIGGSVRSLPSQVNAEGDEISYQIALTTSGDTPRSFQATNLPPGLRIDATTGLISGTIANGAAAGSPYMVTVSASPGNAEARFSDTFSWVITSPPPLLKDLRTFSGKSLLIRTYEFTVQK
jgi:hypothetical protein